MERFSHQKIGAGGFTLIELIIVIVVIGILASMGSAFIAKPIEGYNGLARRSALVDAAENALRRMQRDIRQALPNSVRVGCGGACLELLHAVGGGRYRAEGPGDILDFTANDASFDVIGPLRQAPAAGLSLIVYNISPSAAAGNAYLGVNRAVVGSGSTTTSVSLDPSFKFPFSSPNQRFFLVDSPVTYLCDIDDGTLTRHSGYAIQHPQPTTVAALGAGILMADNISACDFTYNAGASQRADLVTLELSLSDQGEKVPLLHQVHVGNAP